LIPQICELLKKLPFGTVDAFDSLDIHLRIPDLWQQEALAHVKSGRDVVVDAPTGAGKTYLVELASEGFKAGQIVLAVPTRALANDKLREFRAKGWRVGIVTGDVTLNPQAPLVVATLETQKHRLLSGEGPRLLVIDEYQMIGDAARGVSYELCIALAPMQTQLLLLSGSVSNPADIASWLQRLGRSCELVSVSRRPVPLEEVHLDALQVQAPPSVKGFWPRMIARALISDMGPVLVFSPRRKAAEKLARQLAGALPQENPLCLSSEQRRFAGGALSKLLAKRVAYHHSGLSYEQRAGIVEPLAKAGQLRIVVSTTGLAAGVNFSMRSVLITESEYSNGELEQQILPSELLQMYGRAGRRGFDSVGYALVAPDRPTLRQCRQMPIRGPALLDWPSLIGVMDLASAGEVPFEKALKVCGRLAQAKRERLGVERCLASPDVACGIFVDAERARYASANSIEILNSLDQWEPRSELRSASLSELRLRRDDRWQSALQTAGFLESLAQGRECWLEGESGAPARKGLKRVLGFKLKARPDSVRLAAWLREAFAGVGRPIGKVLKREKLAAQPWGVLPLCGELLALKMEGFRVAGIFDLSEVKVECVVDSHGAALWEPPTRRDYPPDCKQCEQRQVCVTELSRERSPALAWRQLELVDRVGRVSQRGRIFSFFHGGEGLAIAAAIEDDSYAVDAIAGDLANLRAGYRFGEYTRESDRLSRACRRAYGDRSYAGYLKHGLPLSYGEGAAEVVQQWLASPRSGKRLLGESLSYGDVQRVILEWMSLLRQVAGAPDLPNERWSELKACARAVAEQRARSEAFGELPALEPAQLGRADHRLRFPRR